MCFLDFKPSVPECEQGRACLYFQEGKEERGIRNRERKSDCKRGRDNENSLLDKLNLGGFLSFLRPEFMLLSLPGRSIILQRCMGIAFHLKMLGKKGLDSM